MGFGDTFKALADPARREILTMLKSEGRMTAGQIGARFQLTGATVSYHLAQLKKAGLVYEERVKNYIYYDINVSVVEELMLWLAQFREEKEENHEKEP